MTNPPVFALRSGETWRNPFDLYAALRDRDPVHHVAAGDFYVLTRFADVWAAAGDAAVCVMHMRGEPSTMQQAPHYADVVADVESFLCSRIAACEAAGIARQRLVVDPGFGFGKTLEHNLRLLDALPRRARLGVPLLVGLSRKSMIQQLVGRPVA